MKTYITTRLHDFAWKLFAISFLLPLTVEASTYTVVDISALANAPGIPLAINDAGVVVGAVATSSGDLHLFRYAQGTFEDLGSIPGTDTVGWAVNTSGTIAGSAQSIFGATNSIFTYNAGHFSDLGTLGGLVCFANGIDDNGAVIGTVTDSSLSSLAFRYFNGTKQTLGTLGGDSSLGWGVSKSGTYIVGGANKSLNGLYHAMLYSNSNMTDLGTLGGSDSMAYAVNNSGWVVGGSSRADTTRHAFLYKNSQMIDLGSLNLDSMARAINESGVIVGSCGFTEDVVSGPAFIYENSTMTDLNTLVSLSGVKLVDAFGINASGQIIAEGDNDHMYLLTPSLNPTPTKAPTPSPTPTPTKTPTPSISPTPTPTPTKTPTPSISPTPTPTAKPSSTPTPTVAPSASATPTPTRTPTPLPSATPSPTRTPSPTASPSPSPSPTKTPTPSISPTPTPTSKPSSTPTPTVAPTGSATPTPTRTPTPLPSATPSPTRTPTPTVSPSPTPSPTKTPTPTPIQVNASPQITIQPVSVTQLSGTNTTLSIATSPGTHTYQWSKNDVPIAGATSANLSLNNLSVAAEGYYAVTVTNTAGSVTSRLARVTVAAPNPGRIVNMSVRSVAGLNGNPLIVGFVVSGGSKNILVRTTGPALKAFSLSGTLDDPKLSLHATVNSTDTIVASNDNWGGAGMAAQLTSTFEAVGAFALSDTKSLDAALIASCDGPRTALSESSLAGKSGIVLVEAYDAGTGTTPKLINVSARNWAGTNENTLIVGFVIDGNVPKKILVRGVGPTLQNFKVSGFLMDPTLELHTQINKVDTVVATNDDWGTEPGVAAASLTAGAFTLNTGSKDAAILVTLPPAAYTGLVTGTGGLTGEALVEVYEVP